MNSKTIAVVGTVNVDTTLIVKRVPDAGESVKAQGYTQSCGGKGANSAISSFRSSHIKSPIWRDGEDGTTTHEFVSAFNTTEINVRLIAAIGKDSNGEICKDNLARNGIDVSQLRVIDDAITGLSFCVVEEDTGQNRIMSHRGANDRHEVDFYRDPAFLQGIDLLISHLALPLNIVEQILETAGRAGVDILLNAAPAQSFYRKLWKYITHLIVNETEAGILSGQDPKDVTVETCPRIAEKFMKKGVQNVVITLGEHGAYFATKGTDKQIIGGHVEAFHVAVKDTTGAGDTFVGAYASNYLLQRSQNRWDIRESVERARSASSWTIGEVGAQSAIPWSNEIEEMQTRHQEPEMEEKPKCHQGPEMEEIQKYHEGTGKTEEPLVEVLVEG